MSGHDAFPAGTSPGGAALLIIDMINDFDFPQGEQLADRASAVAPAILRLRDQADSFGAPTIYVNDNYGHWCSERSSIIEFCARQSPSRDLILQMAPRRSDYFVIKPQFSGFYATNLPVLLPRLGVDRLVLTGIAADICVLFTAADAHMRDYDLWIPEDAVASDCDARKSWALGIMRNSMSATTTSAQSLTLEAWAARPAPQSADRARR